MRVASKSKRHQSATRLQRNLGFFSLSHEEEWIHSKYKFEKRKKKNVQDRDKRNRKEEQAKMPADLTPKERNKKII